MKKCKPDRDRTNGGPPGRDDGKGHRTLTLIAAAVFILGLAAMAGIYLESNSTISEVRFTGYHFTELKELEDSFEAPVGIPPDSIRFMDLIESVVSLPYIAHAGVRVEARGRMIVDVRERQPLAMLIDGSNRIYIDEEGNKMPAIPGRAVNVPLLYGFTIGPESKSIDGDEFEAVRDMLTAARDSGFGWITISEIAWSRDEGVIALSHENGVKLIFGHDDYEEKMRHWEAFYTEVVREKGIGQLSIVDLRYRNQIVTR